MSRRPYVDRLGGAFAAAMLAMIALSIWALLIIQIVVSISS